MKWLRYCSYAGAIVNVLFYTSILVATFAYSLPAPGETMLEQSRSSRNLGSLRLTLPLGFMGLILDLYILVLPIAGVSKLQLPTRKKIGVIAVFLTGLM